MKRALLGILVFLLIVTSVNSATINVPADQPTIQAGIDASVNGDTVLVASGTYTENLLVNNKSILILSMAGAEQTIIHPLNPNSRIIAFSNLTTGSTELNGFTLTGCGNPHTIELWSSNTFPTIIINNIFHSNSVGITNNNSIIRCDAPAIIKNNEFFKNGGINCIWASSSYPVEIINNTFDSNNRGIWSTSNTTIAFNNIITNNDGYGLLGTYNIFDYNNVWNNSTDNNPGPNGISVDPFFVDALNDDYNLSDSSPCIDAGNPDALYNDPDSTRNDMGAFYYRFSKTYYIDTNGDDNVGDGTSLNPFATIQRGIDASFRGDTIMVASGTYVGNINFQGKSIFLLSSNGPSSPTIIASELTSPTILLDSITGVGAVIEGFHFASTNNNRLNINHNSTVLVNSCSFDVGPEETILINNGSSATITNNQFVNGSNPAITSNYSNLNVTNNMFLNISHTCIIITSTFSKIINNTFDSNKSCVRSITSGIEVIALRANISETES